jgi:HEAT repeat protein
LVLAAAAATATADSWMAPVAERFVDSGGDYHVVVSPAGKFKYARRGSANDALDAKRDAEGGWKSDRTIPIRKGDVLIAEGELPHRPMEVVVSNRGSGFVAIDQYAQLGYGDIVVVVDSAGRITHRKKLVDLFPKVGVGVFQHSVSSIWWRTGAWMDDDNEEAVIVANGGRVRIVRLASGDVREGGPEDIVRALDHPSAVARDMALDLVRDKKIVGVEPALVDLLGDADSARSTRLRVAVILAERGDLAGKDVLVEAAQSPRPEGISEQDHAYAIENLPAVLGVEALPLLRKAMRGPATDAWHPAQLAFASLGEKAVPTLLEMLAEVEESPDYRGGAAHALGKLRSESALEGLLAAVGDENEYTANAAANAAIAIGGADCAAALVAHLRRGCTQDGRIAMFFEKVSYRDSIPPLIGLLERSNEDDFDRGRAIDALKFQTMEDFGGDVVSWRRWWKEQ